MQGVTCNILTNPITYMRKIFTLNLFAILIAGMFTVGCDDLPTTENGEGGSGTIDQRFEAFGEISQVQLEGGETAAEISAYDAITKKLFVCNATKPGIDIIDMQDPSNLVLVGSISILPYGAGVNSIHVHKGRLVAAIESDPKTNPGKVVVWQTNNFTTPFKIVTVGALPDMVTFSPNGRFILVANEGEPNEDNTIDPKGSISIIDINNGYSVVNLDFSSFNNQLAALKAKTFRVFNSSVLAEDVEPEYITVSDDSRMAWVSLQENNALARINLITKRIEAVLPLGIKDHQVSDNSFDASDRDGGIVFNTWSVKGLYLPDGVAGYRSGYQQYVISANEGDSRLRPTSDDALPGFEEGEIYNEESRIKDVLLDPIMFPDAAAIQKNEKLGRLKITNTLGDVDGDGDFDALYAFGARSFSIWNGATGELVYDCGNKLEKFLLEKRPDLYDDGRSDDKGVEPESVITARYGKYTIAFIGLERADAVVVVDVTNPTAPQFLQVLETGDAPEGLLFIPANESPNGKCTLVVSSEGDGFVKVYQPTSMMY